MSSNVLAFYRDRMESLVNTRGFTDNALILRRGKTQNPYTISDHKNILFDLDAKTDNGDIVERNNGDKYIILSKQISADCISMQGKRINAKVSLSHISNKFANGKKVGLEEEIYADNLDAYVEENVANMQRFDSGLLPHTVKKIYLQLGYNVTLLDRVILNGKNYQVDDVAREKYRNMIVVQVSEDTRK